SWPSVAVPGLWQDFQGRGGATDNGAGPGAERVGGHFAVRRAVSDLRDSWGTKVGPDANQARPDARQMLALVLLPPTSPFWPDAPAPANLVPLPNRNLPQRPRVAGPADG